MTNPGDNKRNAGEDSEIIGRGHLVTGKRAVRGQLLVSILLTVFAAFSLSGLPFLGFDDDLESLFRGNTREFNEYKKYSRMFGADDRNFVVLLSAPNVLSVTSLKRIRLIDDAFHQLDNLEGIQSLCHLLDAKRIGRIYLPVVPFSGAEEAAWIKAGEALHHHALGHGILYSRDHKSALITFRISEMLSQTDRKNALKKVTQILYQQWIDAEGTGVLKGRESGTGPADLRGDQDRGFRRFGVTGVPVLRWEVTRNLQRDQRKFTWLGLVFALVIGWFVFRKPVPVILVAAIPFLGLGCIMGLLGWLGMSLNIVNNVITPLVLVIGFAEVIHILFLTGGFIGQGEHYRAAVIHSVQQLFLPCLLAALTTAIGFASLYLSADRSLREFAMVASVSSMVMFVMVLLVSSCLLATPLARFCIRVTPDQPRKATRVISTRLNRRAILTVFAISAVFLLAAGWTASCNHTDYRFTENLPERNNAVKTLRQIDQAFGGSSNDQLVLQFDTQPSPEQLIQQLRDLRQQVESKSIVRQTTSLLDLLDTLPPQGGTDLEHFRELNYLPRESWRGFLQIKPTIACFHLKLPDAGSARLELFLDKMEADLSEIEQENPDLSVTISGLNVLAVKRSQQMIGDLSRSLLGASLAIFFLIIVVYQDAAFAIAAIIVNAIPILGVAAIMSLVGQPIQYTGIMLLCVCLGLAVDDTVHFLSKLRIELKSESDYEQAVWNSVARLWPVFVSTSLMLGVGFGLAATSEIPTFQTFGGFACLALLLALIADLFVLPCLLIGMHRLKIRNPMPGDGAR